MEANRALGIIGMYVSSHLIEAQCSLITGELSRPLPQKVCILSNLVFELTVAATGFSKAFPGITPHLLTLASNFKMPFYRDVALALGISSVSKRSCINILKSGPGHSITIVIGGAAESLSAHPGTADLTLRRRSVVLLTL